MSADDFERRLQRAFAEAPAYPDEQLFAARVQTRLDQGEAVRRSVIAIVGSFGALIAVAQLLSAGLGTRASQLSAGAGEAARIGWGALTRDASGLMAAAPLGGELAWTVAALGGTALALVASRFIDDRV